MYTAEIGRQFLKLYNTKTGKNSSAESFFEEEFFPVFFNAEDYMHLMQVHGSHFFQPSYKKLAEKENVPIPDFRKRKFEEAMSAVDKREVTAHGGLGVGFKAGSVAESTSGQVSNIDILTDKETLLYSWLGGALGIGFGGGYDVLFDDPEINWYIYLGWQKYRNYLNEAPNMKGRQIETWNGLWLLYGLKNRDQPNQAYKEVKQGLSRHLSENKGVVQLSRPNNWIEQVSALAKGFKNKDQKQLLGYAYNFGQMNKTLGFFYIQLPEIRNLHEIYDNYLEKDPQLGNNTETALEKVLKTQFNLEKAIAQGGIGLRALKPKDLFKFTAGSKQKEMAQVPKLDKQEKRIQFLTYKTWLTAMLNNEQTLELTEKLAQNLLEFTQGEKRLTSRERAIEELWESSNRQQMIDHLVNIQKEAPDLNETLNETVNTIMTELPQDNFRLFLTLTKFKYHYFLNVESKQEKTVQ